MKIRNFLWKGGKTQGRNLNLVKWEAVIENKNGGGLGIRDLRRMNQALGAKIIFQEERSGGQRL